MIWYVQKNSSKYLLHRIRWQVIDMNHPFRYRFQQVRHFDFDILIVMIGFFITASSPFVYCFFGKITIECYANMADRLFEINWQQLPNDLQKYCILMIENMQRPLYYHGFEIIILNLETFQQVNRKYWSWFGIDIQMRINHLIFFCLSDSSQNNHILYDVQSLHGKIKQQKMRWNNGHRFSSKHAFGSLDLLICILNS